MSTPVTLSMLASETDAHLVGDESILVSGIHHDHGQVSRGDLFCCVVGTRFDGHTFAEEAVSAGAVALLVERPVAVSVPQLLVRSVRLAMPIAASVIFDHPERSLKIIGITGTDGKSTSSFILGHLMESKAPTRAIGNLLPSGRNTPEAPELFRELAGFVREGLKMVIVEASSAGLVAHRLDGLAFVASIFTNLSEYHIGEVHSTMEEYFSAKQLLFDSRTHVGVINRDDPYGLRILQSRLGRSESYGLDDAKDLQSLGAEGTRFSWRGTSTFLPLGGQHNVYNALAAMTTAELAGVDVQTIATRLRALPQVPGRLERIPVSNGATIVIDYAHTPAGLQSLLQLARESTDDRIVLVFGCGGNRDKSKRPVMGRIAASLADTVILTSDNPRGEDPQGIIQDIMSGIGGLHAQVEVSLDRVVAVRRAIDFASAGDIVILAGKGAESYQEVQGSLHPYGDKAVVTTILEELGMRGNWEPG